ncbi:glycosyltransferase family 2 protein [Chryseobacterium manosquense]|uniref:Glycosyltransferase family 2 protein n=1 Tax=Chryseobacterium manosquense TaxID=2754694 RepID=A0A7H1DWF6_9FLAO|nr:glycosyltransferase family 2 protein [Chryseobacterium manosquense]QNS41314.1 glycosyltransferase family 2 protein [Chryseobacterium manosquense]
MAYKNLISIIIPVYNAELYLKECISSILSQTYENIEIILVNDGSTDNSLDICYDFQKNDNRVKIFSKKNQGVSETRNYGINNAKGDYITFIDSDDTIDSNYIQDFVEFLVEDIDIIIQGYKHIYLNKKYTQQMKFPQNQDTLDSLSNYELILYADKNDILKCPYSKLYCRKIIADNNLKFDDKISYGEDHIFVLNFLLYCNNIKTITQNCGYNHYHRDNDSLSSKNIDFSLFEYYNDKVKYYRTELNKKFNMTQSSLFANFIDEYYAIYKTINIINLFVKKNSYSAEFKNQKVNTYLETTKFSDLKYIYYKINYIIFKNIRIKALRKTFINGINFLANF